MEDKLSLSLIKKKKEIEKEIGYNQFFDKLFRRIATENLTMAGAPMTIYHSKEYTPTGYDIEFAIPIKEFVKGTRDFNVGLCIKSVLKDSYSEITPIYAKQYEYAEKEKYELVKPPFDVYVTDPSQVLKQEENITKIYMSVKKI